MAPALVLSLLLPLLQVVSVDQGLSLLEAGEPLEAVEPSVGKAAAERVAAAPDPLTLHRLSTLARLGGAEAALGRALVRVVAAGQGPLLAGALDEASHLSDDALAAGDLPPVALATLVDLLWSVSPDDGQEQAALGAVLLAGPRADPAQLAGFVAAWAPEPTLRPRAERLVAGLARSRQPLAAYDALLGLELPAPLAAHRTAALVELVRRSPEVADEALTRSGLDPAAGDSVAVVVRSLGGLRLSDEPRWRRGAELLAGLLAARDLTPGLRAAALLAAGELLVPDVVPLLPPALRDADPGVRCAAAATIGLVGYRDGPTVDLLIEALADPAPEVADAVLAALVRKTGQRLPAQLALWRRYRAAATLPAHPPQSAAERLGAERRLRADVERRLLERGKAPRAPAGPDFASRPRRVPGDAARVPRWGAAPVPGSSPGEAAVAATPAPEVPASSRGLWAAGGASLALLLVGLALFALPEHQRGLVIGGPRARSIARDIPIDTTRERPAKGRKAPGPEVPLQDAVDELEAAEVPGLSLSSAHFAGLVVGKPPANAVPLGSSRKLKPQPLVLPLGTAAQAQADRTFERLLATLPRVPGLASLAVRLTLEGGAGERRLLFRAGQELAPALANLRALGPLVGDVTVTLEAHPLDLVVFERAPVAAREASGPSWERLVALVARDGALFEELEVLTCGVWRRIQGAGEEPTAALVRLASLGPELVDEVRGLVKGGTRVRLHERAGRPRPPGTPWAQLLEGLQRRAHAVVELEVDDGSGWRSLFSAADGPRLEAARAELLDRPGGAARAILRGSLLAVDLPDDPASRDALVDELGLDALERLELAGEPLFEARDGASREQALQELVRAGAGGLAAVRARLAGDAEAPELAWTRDASAPKADTRRAARAQPAVDLGPVFTSGGRLDTAVRERQAGLARALDALGRLAPGALDGLSVRLGTEPAPVALPGGEAGLRALRALAPLVERLVVRARSCPLELVVWEGSAAPSAAGPSSAGDFLRGLEGTLAAFDLVEVREAGRLWRTVKDEATTDLEALTALGGLSAVREVRACVAGERVTLFREGDDAPDAWTTLLAELHRLAPTLESITLADPRPRTLFMGSDAARFAALRERLSGWQVDRLALRVCLRRSALELPLLGTRAEVTTALEELGPAAVQTVALDEPGAAPLFEARDAAPLGVAIGTLAALDPARVGEVRVRAAGAAERVIFPAG